MVSSPNSQQVVDSPKSCITLEEIAESHPKNIFAEKVLQQIFIAWCYEHLGMDVVFTFGKSGYHNVDQFFRTDGGGVERIFLPSDIDSKSLMDFVRQIQTRFGIEMNEICEMGSLLEDIQAYFLTYAFSEYVKKDSEEGDVEEGDKELTPENVEKKEIKDKKRLKEFELKGAILGFLDEYRQVFQDTEKKGGASQQVVLGNKEEGTKLRVEAFLLGEDKLLKRLARFENEEEKELWRRNFLRRLTESLLKPTGTSKGDFMWEVKRSAFGAVQDVFRKGVSDIAQAPWRMVNNAVHEAGKKRFKEEFVPAGEGVSDEVRTRLLEGSLDMTDPRNFTKLRKLFTDNDEFSSYEKDYLSLLRKGPFYEQLGVPEKKKKLEEVRKEGNSERISKLELAYVGEIQRAIIEGIPYDVTADTPQKIIALGKTNCVGAGLLAATSLFDELGISYVQGLTDEHALFAIQTHNKEVHLRDMQIDDTNVNMESDDMRRLFSVHKGYCMEFPRICQNDEIKERLTCFLGREGSVQNTIYFNMACELRLGDRTKDHALVILDDIIERDPSFLFAYEQKGVWLARDGHLEEALKVFYQALSIEPDFTPAQNYIQAILIGQGDTEEFVQFIKDLTKSSMSKPKGGSEKKEQDTVAA